MLLEHVHKLRKSIKIIVKVFKIPGGYLLIKPFAYQKVLER